MSRPSSDLAPKRTPILLGCVGALVMSILSCCALTGLGASPALGGSVPPSPDVDPARHDITILVGESFLNRVLTDSLPATMTGEARLDIQPDNRLVATSKVNLLLVEVEVVITLRITAEAGRLQLAVESVDAGGQDIVELLGQDPSTLNEILSSVIQDQIEAGLGEGSQVLGIHTDDEYLTITARWKQ